MIEIDDTDLERVVKAFRSMSKEQKAGMRRGIKRFDPLVKAYLGARARDPVQRALAKSAKVGAVKDGMVVRVGTSGKWGSSPGVTLRELARPWEFGGRQQRYEQYVSRRKGTRSFVVNRRTQRQIPPRNPTGYFVYPAIAEAVPELASMWVGALYLPLRKEFG